MLMVYNYNKKANGMALTNLQNCQRIIIFMQFLTLFLVVVLLTIRIIKKKIDITAPHEEQPADSGAAKYQESDSQQHIGSGAAFDGPAISSNTFTEYDTCTERLMKKMGEINVIFSPLLITLPLNLVLGRSYSFSVVIYFAATFFCIVFNVFKIHRACIEYQLSRLFLQSIWIVLSLLLLINIWVIDPNTMLYTIRAP